MYISHQYYIPVHVALKSQSILGVKSHHFSLPYICISIVVVLGMFRYGSLYIFRLFLPTLLPGSIGVYPNTAVWYVLLLEKERV